MSPSACSSLLILYIVQICIAFHHKRLENGICNFKGGLCLPSNASNCNPLDAKCDEGNICYEESTAVPIKEMAARSISKQEKASCNSKTQDIINESGSISVWSEKKYENNLDCEWKITVDAGKVILIEWVKFDIEYHSLCNYDYVEILGQKLCGYNMPDSITTPNSHVLVKFHSDSSVTKKGFSLTFSMVLPTITTTTTPTTIASPACGIVNRRVRIVGGEETLLHEYPWQAAITDSWYDNGITPYCGGSIISNRWILTAAHCVKGTPITRMQVVVGEHDWSTSDETTFTRRVNIETVVMHPDYNKLMQWENDIALIKLMSELIFTEKNRVAPICLPPLDIQDQFENVDVTISGWGNLVFNGHHPNVLQEVTVPTMSNTQCQKMYYWLSISDGMICTGLLEGGKGACQGDSGGPVIMEANGGRMVQIGVVSFGVRCASPRHPGVQARVTTYIPWILQHVDDASFYPEVAG